jgi:RND family efflux transporter MFP subunit
MSGRTAWLRRGAALTAAAPLACALLASGSLVGCSKGGAAPGKGRPPPLVRAIELEARDVPVEVRAPVDLRPLEQADCGSKLLGYVDAVLVDRGDVVKKGQTVALVRPSDLPDQLTAARGAVAQSQAALALAQANAERTKQLAPTGVVSQAEIEQSAAALASARAAESAAKAQLSAFGVRLGETRIESPLDGVVLVRRLDPGALVGPPGGGAIVTVARTDVLRVFVTVGERDAAGLTLGLDARVEVDAVPGKSYSGKVVRLAPAFDALTRTLEAEVRLDNHGGELRPGMYGRGAIVLAVHPHATVVPIEAVQVADKRRYVFVVRGDKVERRIIESGVDGGDWLEVLSGVSVGDHVVVAGADGLSDGAAVRVAKEAKPTPGASSAPAVPSASASSSAPAAAASVRPASTKE